MTSMRVILCLSVSLCLGALHAPDVRAQAPARSGFFIGFGLGLGSFGVEDADGRESSGTGYFKIGGALNDRVLLGAESNSWLKEEGGATITSSNLAATVYFYPSATGGLFLKGGLGLSYLEIEAAGFGSADDTGTGVILGAGYDVGFGGRFGLTPFVGLVYNSHEGVSTNLLQIGLGVNWY
jgi:hypothetical protein